MDNFSIISILKYYIFKMIKYIVAMNCRNFIET